MHRRHLLKHVQPTSLHATLQAHVAKIAGQHAEEAQIKDTHDIEISKFHAKFKLAFHARADQLRVLFNEWRIDEFWQAWNRTIEDVSCETFEMPIFDARKHRGRGAPQLRKRVLLSLAFKAR